jgi:hypothetical protein
VTETTTLPAPEEANEALRAWNKGSETRVYCANKPPQHPKENQAQSGVTTIRMPLHPVAADIDTDHRTRDADNQKPMKQPGWQIPNAQGSFHNEKNKAIPQAMLAMGLIARCLNRS